MANEGQPGGSISTARVTGLVMLLQDAAHDILIDFKPKVWLMIWAILEEPNRGLRCLIAWWQHGVVVSGGGFQRLAPSSRRAGSIWQK